MITTHRFVPVTAKLTATFSCPFCGKDNRKRTITVQHTVNPFNLNADGSIRSAKQVQHEALQQATTQREGFLAAPACMSCEIFMPASELRELRRKRTERSSAGLSPSQAPATGKADTGLPVNSPKE